MNHHQGKAVSKNHLGKFELFVELPLIDFHGNKDAISDRSFITKKEKWKGWNL